jgi:hypothetical protein
MRTNNAWILCLLGLAALAGLAGFSLRAAEPAATGTLLLLDNERTIEGDVERDGAYYRVRRASGETQVPAGKVLALCASREDGYRFLKARANLSDPDERLRLARWCHLHQLREQALAEVQAAVQLRPGDAESRRLLTYLQKPLPPPSVLEAKDPDKPAIPLPVVDLSAESLCRFTTRVQPILMNACAGCHASGKAGAFKLTRVYDGSNHRTTQENVTAVLAQLNLDRPQGSPLLTKAVSAHGQMAQAPLKGRDAEPFQALEEWVRLTVETNPNLREQAGPPPAAPVPDARPTPEPAPTTPATPAAPPEPAPKSAEPTGFAETAQPPPQVKPKDEFDPLIFNRLAHPEKMK